MRWLAPGGCAQPRAVKGLSDYRGLGEKNKLRAYMIARSFFIS